MPKKFKGENSKAVTARERKAAVRHEAEERKRREEEDAYWRDDDKQAARKQERKMERERKRTEQLDKKQEAKRLLEAEEASLPSKGGAGPTKMTRAQIEAAHRQSVAAAAAPLPKGVTEDPVLEDNPNHLLRQRQAEGHLDARTVEEAITVLGGSQSEVDIHPEKRMKAAYAAFEEKELPRLKQENPNMRLSQIKQMLRKDWMKSPENPLNQALRSRH